MPNYNAQLKTIRFIDLCAGLGGFHHATSVAQKALGLETGPDFRCVLASELDPVLRQLYPRNFRDLGLIYRRYHSQGRVNALAEHLEATSWKADLPSYSADGELMACHGDMALLLSDDGEQLRLWHDPTSDSDWLVPEHDLLFAGFPCQPFSKSGQQLGFEDLRGTVFHMIAVILKSRKPRMVLLENVGNFDRHDQGNTWKRVRETLEGLGYDVRATRHKASGDEDSQGLLSPHQLGLPHHRERFFIAAQLRDAPGSLRQISVFPPRLRSSVERQRMMRMAANHLHSIVSDTAVSADPKELEEAQISSDRVTAIEHWNRLLERMARDDAKRGQPLWLHSMPSFPIWGFELDPWNWYPIDRNPAEYADDLAALNAFRKSVLGDVVARLGLKGREMDFSPSSGPRRHSVRLTEHQRDEWVSSWPAYAGKRTKWPDWKVRFIRQNRSFAVRLWGELGPEFMRDWLDQLVETVPAPSNQKLEWNCKGEELDLWKHVLQFRPSGLRAKRFGSVPALVAMTSTQIPIVPRLNLNEGLHGGDLRSKGRHLLRSEGILLQSFPPGFSIPLTREKVFKALGNAVNCELVATILERWLDQRPEAVQADFREALLAVE